jgi:hypothetical protein
MLSDPNALADQAFPDLDLGDTRRQGRFRRVVDVLFRHPEKTLPDKFHTPAEYQACLRLFDGPRATHENIFGCYQEAALNRLEDHPGPILLIHDTTQIDYSGHQTLKSRLGQIGNGGGRGYLLHHTLAVNPQNQEVLGLVGQIIHVRPAVRSDEPVAKKRERKDRESRLWVRGLEEIGPTPADRTWIHVCDRGADIFEFLQTLHRGSEAFLIRSTHNRALCPDDTADTDAILDSEEKALARLHDELRGLPAQTTWTHELTGRVDQLARVAQLSVAAMSVTLRPPHVRKGNFDREGIPVTAIRVWEAAPPADAEALEWILLASDAVNDIEALKQVVQWYSCRMWIEEYHKVQKTGVGIERLQVQDAKKLQALIGVLSVVTVALLNLRVAARDPQQAEQPAERYVPQLWVEILSRWRHREYRQLTVAEFTLALGRLGGHLNRKRDGLPGWITLWRGWERLHTMIEYELSRARCT